MSRSRRQPAGLLNLELPTLDVTRCVGGGMCTEVCPTDCLEMHGRMPWLARPLDCVSCGLCAAVCPADAIKMSIVG